MRADSFGPPVLRGFERGGGSLAAVALEPAVEEAGGVMAAGPLGGGKNPPPLLLALPSGMEVDVMVCCCGERVVCGAGQGGVWARF